MIKAILFILLASNANAGKVVMEGIDTTNSTIFVDTTNTRVGISTNAPSYRLDVYGDIRATGTIYGAFSPNATVPPAYIDLSTVTTALAGKLTAPATFYVVKTSDYLVAPASFTYLSNASAFLVAPASFTYQAPGITVLKAGDTMTGSLVGTNAYMSANVTADTMTVTGPSFSVGGSTLVVSGGRVGVGDAVPTTKLGLKDGSFYLNDADVAHGITAAYPTDVYGAISPQSDTDGGLSIAGINDTNADRALALYGYIGSDNPTDSYAAIHLQGGKKNGTGLQALADAESVMRVRNYATEILTLKGNGRLGINTTTPGSTLHVVGDATISTSLTASSGTFTGGLWVGANAYFVADVSALTFTDRTPYPETLANAYAEIESIKRSPDNPKQVDHSALHPNLKRPFKHQVVDSYETVLSTYTESVDGEDVIKTREEQKPVYKEVLEQGRDLSETVSALVEVVKDLNKRIKELEKK